MVSISKKISSQTSKQNILEHKIVDISHQGIWHFDKHYLNTLFGTPWTACILKLYTHFIPTKAWAKGKPTIHEGAFSSRKDLIKSVSAGSCENFYSVSKLSPAWS